MLRQVFLGSVVVHEYRATTQAILVRLADQPIDGVRAERLLALVATSIDDLYHSRLSISLTVGGLTVMCLILFHVPHEDCLVLLLLLLHHQQQVVYPLAFVGVLWHVLQAPWQRELASGVVMDSQLRRAEPATILEVLIARCTGLLPLLLISSVGSALVVADERRLCAAAALILGVPRVGLPRSPWIQLIFDRAD